MFLVLVEKKGRKLTFVLIYYEAGIMLGILCTPPNLCGKRRWALISPFYCDMEIGLENREVRQLPTSQQLVNVGLG